MKFAIAGLGSRGDLEPCVAVGRELVRRGHDVRIGVSPDMVGFAEAAGLAEVAYGPDIRELFAAQRDQWTCLLDNFWKIRDLIRFSRDATEPITRCWGAMSAALTSLTDGADLLLTNVVFETLAANVAEFHHIPLATLHYFPKRPTDQILPFLPSPVGRTALAGYEWLSWRVTRKVEDAQRRELGLPKSGGPAFRRIIDRGSLEIQAYDEVFFPGLATEWARWIDQRPLVGALTMELPTDADEEIASWIAAGTPPIYVGFGSSPLESPADDLAMIGAACAQLGERALVCSGWAGFRSFPQGLPHIEHVKVVGAVNHAATFPACRAVVHHGGAGTTAAGLRAGMPTLILWSNPDQALFWGTQVKRLGVGTARHFSATTQESLVADLRTILEPSCGARARELATRMTTPAASLTDTADLLENFARLGRVRRPS